MRFLPHLKDFYLAFRGECVPILAFHSVSHHCDPFAVTPDTFERMMIHIKESNYKVLTLKEAVDGLTNANVPGRSLAITFDDGYMDNYINALPVLRNLNFAATFFVVTGNIANKSIWDKQCLDLMGWDHLKELANNGHSIGSHTHSHVRLTNVSSPLQLHVEILQSKQMIHDKVDTDWISFAYPYSAGVYNQDVHTNLIRAGYTCAVTSTGYFGNNSTTDKWQLKRIRIDHSTTLAKFKEMVSYAKDRPFMKHTMCEFIRLIKTSLV